MSKSPWIKNIGALLSVAVLCGAVGGCVADMGSSMPGAVQSPNDRPAMRYYGGPKSPMWSS